MSSDREFRTSSLMRCQIWYAAIDFVIEETDFEEADVTQESNGSVRRPLQLVA